MQVRFCSTPVTSLLHPTWTRCASPPPCIARLRYACVACVTPCPARVTPCVTPCVTSCVTPCVTPTLPALRLRCGRAACTRCPRVRTRVARALRACCTCACYALFAGTTFAIGALAAAAAHAAAKVLPALVSNLALGCLLRCPPLSPLRQAARPGPGEGAPAPQTTASHLCCGRPRYACVIHCTRVTLHATSALRPRCVLVASSLRPRCVRVASATRRRHVRDASTLQTSYKSQPPPHRHVASCCDYLCGRPIPRHAARGEALTEIIKALVCAARYVCARYVRCMCALAAPLRFAAHTTRVLRAFSTLNFCCC